MSSSNRTMAAAGLLVLALIPAAGCVTYKPTAHAYTREGAATVRSSTLPAAGLTVRVFLDSRFIGEYVADSRGEIPLDLSAAVPPGDTAEHNLAWQYMQPDGKQEALEIRFTSASLFGR